MLTAYFSDWIEIPLPPGHHFPQAKYRLLRERLAGLATSGKLRLAAAEPVTKEQVLRVHTDEYFERVQAGTLSPAELRELGFPWSPEFVRRTLLSCGATVMAAAEAMGTGAAVHLAGGTHHASADRASGFCVLNDVAVAIRDLQVRGLGRRALVVDCDVHHGDGTALLFAGDPDVFTLSLHGARNYPRWKPPSSLDVPLADGTGDDEYLRKLAEALEVAFAWAQQGEAPVVFYLAGADPLATDKYGRMQLSKAGLAERDRLVLRHVGTAGLRLVATMAGGYSRSVADTVDAHVTTVALMAEWHAQRTGG